MEKIVILLLSSFFTSTLLGQNSNVINKDTISIIYDIKAYQKVASDSIVKIYNMQVQSKINGGISSFYKLDELSLISIPQYKIKKSAFLFYRCNEEIENFIDFQDTLKYQGVSLLYDEKEIAYITIPNLSTEMEKTFDLKKGTLMDKSLYLSEVLDDFRVMPSGKNGEKKCWQERPNNFFFSIYGLWGIFEVEKDTGKVYANYTIYETYRVPINDFIRDVIGEEKIKSLSIGVYEEINGTHIWSEDDCNKFIFKNDNIFVKFNGNGKN
jgi:hypothetical protein